MTMSPTPFLIGLIGKAVIVKLKWGQEYKGFLVSSDKDMNIHLANTEEFIDGSCTGNLGEALVRGNNVLYIRYSSVCRSTGNISSFLVCRAAEEDVKESEMS